MSGEQGIDMARMVAALRAEATATDVVDRLLALTTETLACTRAAATLTALRRGELATSATDSALVLLAELQVLHGVGPAVDVASGVRRHVIVPDLLADSRWPLWSAAAVRAGARSLLCVPLTSDGACVGTLTAYDARVGHFTSYDVATLRLLAEAAGSAVAAACDHEDLWRVIDARRTLGHAQGILMQRESLASGPAFAALQRRSDQQHLTLAAMAQLLVAPEAPPD